MSDQLDPQTQQNILKAQTFQGTPPTERQVPFDTLGDLLERRAREIPDKIFLTYYDPSGARREYTHREFNHLVNQTASLLQSELGIQRGDRVATLAHNHPDVLLTYFAAWKIGAVVVPQNVAEDDRRIAFILENSQSKIIFVHADYLDRARSIMSHAPRVRQLVVIGGVETGSELSFTKAIVRQPRELTPAESPQPTDECLLVYTSGTTGVPKGVVLTQYNLLVNARQTMNGDKITDADRLMCVLPIHHVNGLIVTHVTPLYAGASVVLNRQFSSSHFWQRLADEKVTIASMVPTLLQFLLDADQAIDQYDLAALRFLICGAGTLSVSLADKFERRFGIKIVHGYGLSETTAYACHLPVDLDPQAHHEWLTAYGYPSIGCPFELNEMAIFDSFGEGRELAEGERGEIVIRGHNVMKYYFQRPDANRDTFRYGWFRTGDEGFYRTDGLGRKFFFITGRLKELINRGGVKFSPFDVEEVLAEIPGVRVGLAIAFENIYYGEEIAAYVVLEEGATVSADEILAYCRGRLGFEKSPKVIVFGKDIPVTATGKYQRLKLKPLFAEWASKQFRERMDK